MPPKKPKPPLQSKAELMDETAIALRAAFSTREQERGYLLNMFTALDLTLMRDELHKRIMTT